LGTVSLSAGEWARIIAIASSVLVVDEIGKALRRRRASEGGAASRVRSPRS
jgi:hypothetical protein